MASKKCQQPNCVWYGFLCECCNDLYCFTHLYRHRQGIETREQAWKSRGWNQFVTDLEARMNQGYREYGDRSFERPASELIGELKQEALDIAGWGYLLHVRLSEMERRAKEAEGRVKP